MGYELIIGEPRAVAKRLNTEKDFIPFLTQFIDDADKLLVIGQTRDDVRPVWDTTYEVRYDVDLDVAMDEDGYNWGENAQQPAYGLYLGRKGARGLVLIKDFPGMETFEEVQGEPLVTFHGTADGVVTVQQTGEWPEQDSPVWIGVTPSDNPLEGDSQEREYFKFDSWEDAEQNFSFTRATNQQYWDIMFTVMTRHYEYNMNGGGPEGEEFDTVLDSAYLRSGYLNTDYGVEYSINSNSGFFDRRVIQGPFRNLRKELSLLESKGVAMYGINILRQDKLQFFVLEIGIPQESQSNPT